MWEGGISDQWHIMDTAGNYRPEDSGCAWKSHCICIEKSVFV